MIFKDCLNMHCIIWVFTIKKESMSEIPKHVEQKLQSFFEFLVPSVIGLRSLLYEGQASFSKNTIQEVKVKETKANKVVHL